MFSNEFYEGRITSFDAEEGYWFVTYKDNDTEEWDNGDLERGINLQVALSTYKSHPAFAKIIKIVLRYVDSFHYDFNDFGEVLRQAHQLDGDKSFVLQRANPSKEVFFSYHISCLLDLCGRIAGASTSGLAHTVVDRRIILEAIFAISFTPSPSRWREGVFAALNMCETNGKNLIINYIDYMLEKYQTVSSGDGRRHGPSAGKKISQDQLLKSLFNMASICDKSSTATSSAQDLLMQPVEEGGLFGVGSLTGGEIGYLLTVLGLFSSPSTTGLSVKIATTTTTGKRLADLGIKSDEECQALQQCLNVVLGTNDSDTENIVCESLRQNAGSKNYSIDTFLRNQQYLYKLGSEGSLIQIDANGNEETLPQITFDSTASSSLLLKNAYKWWEEENQLGDSTISILLTTKQPKRKQKTSVTGSNKRQKQKRNTPFSGKNRRQRTASASAREATAPNSFSPSSIGGSGGMYLLYLLRDQGKYKNCMDPHPVVGQVKGHPLRNHQKPEVKDAKRGPTDTACFAQAAINVAVPVDESNNCLFVIHQGLHHVTHGGGVLSEKGAIDMALRNNRVEVVDVPETMMKFSRQRDDDRDGVHVFRSGAAEVVDISMSSTAKQECRRFFCEDRWKKYSSTDGGRDLGNSVWRFDLLFNQSQGYCDQYCDANGNVIVHPDGRPLRVPLLRSQTEMLKMMPNELKQEFIKVLTGLDRLTRKIYPNAFSDERRQRLVKDYFVQEYFGEDVTMNWEYLGVIVRLITDNDRLLMHLDLKNDSREHYDYCATYSFVIDGYRVTFVAACKQDFGRLMERLDGVEVNGGRFQQPNN